MQENRLTHARVVNRRFTEMNTSTAGELAQGLFNYINLVFPSTFSCLKFSLNTFQSVEG